MLKSLLVIGLFIAATTPIVASTLSDTPQTNNSVEQAVLKVVQDWLVADERQDRAALNKIIADDFLGTGPMGTIVSKQDVIPREGTPAQAQGLRINGQDLNARVFGDTAIVTGRGVPKASAPEGRPDIRFTLVFVKRAESWQMVAGHLSAIPKE
jgi:ketosteroid isomerase-like protein